jgi:putative sugar O-methyltransferase
MLQRIKRSYKKSLSDYIKRYKSKHWQKRYKDRFDIINSKYLNNFRNNNFSKDLDDKYERKYQKVNFELFKKEVNEEFFLNFLSTINIGNNKNFFYYKKKIIDSNEIFHLKWIYEIKNYIRDKNIETVCEIGAGYGSLCQKILKFNNIKKYIIIDLPEANLLSSYFLSKHYPNKSYLLYSDLKNKKITKKDVENNDIIIITPWCDIADLKIDFFINTRSFSEMNFSVVCEYFNLIKRCISQEGYFLNINRLEKSTTGQSIKFHNFPYDNHWLPLIYKNSWNQKRLFFFLVQRTSYQNFFKIKIVFLKIKILYLLDYLKVKFNKFKAEMFNKLYN